MNKSFDLNIGKILSNWTNAHAIRELISNAIDESKITKTNPIELSYTDEIVIIKDYGRGLDYKHLILNENNEKNNANLIGQFGIGLKDAVATLYRNNCDVIIDSKFGKITFEKLNKTNFDDINTLHAIISPKNSVTIGTTITITNVRKKHFEEAKSYFLLYTASTNQLLCQNNYGEIYAKLPNKPASIYINGHMVSTEVNFLFSYNITKVTKKIRNSMNRERMNMNKNVYANSIQKIILSCKSETVIKLLIDNMQNKGIEKCDEIKYIKVIKYITDLPEANKNIVYVTQEQMEKEFNIINKINSDGQNIVVLNNEIYDKIKNNPNVNTMTKFRLDYNKEYQYEFIDPSELTEKEREVYDATDFILGTINAKKYKSKIFIANKIREPDDLSIRGVCTRDKIIVRRTQLKSLQSYAGTLIHECTHAITRTSDITLEFENALTNNLGLIIANVYSNNKILNS